MEALVLMVSVKKGYKYKREKKITGRQKSYQSGDNVRDRGGNLRHSPSFRPCSGC